MGGKERRGGGGVGRGKEREGEEREGGGRERKRERERERERERGTGRESMLVCVHTIGKRYNGSGSTCILKQWISTHT